MLTWYNSIRMTRITTRANNNINHKEMTRWLFAQITLIGSSDFDDKIYKKRYFMHYICKTHYLVNSSWNKEKDVLEQKKPVLIEDLNHHGQVSPCHSWLLTKKQTLHTWIFVDLPIQEGCEQIMYVSWKTWMPRHMSAKPKWCFTNWSKGETMCLIWWHIPPEQWHFLSLKIFEPIRKTSFQFGGHVKELNHLLTCWVD